MSLAFPPPREQVDAPPHHKPGLMSLLRSIGLDVEYHRGDGDLLYYHDGDGREVEVLDLVGGYGSLLLGHNHPELLAEATHFLASGRPNHAQCSIRAGAERLAEAMTARVSGDYCVIFANSGTEAVEVAVKHALHETGGRTLIALDGAFHGKTMGALRLTANPQFRERFSDVGLDVVHVPPNDIDQFRAVLAGVREPAGFLFEPIQGEAGVRPVDARFLQQAAALLSERGIPLIADECQTGLGRTGRFLASGAAGVRADYVILSKALGGGLAKVSAVLISRDRYRGSFDLLHSSTFADDEFSSAIALKTLQLLDEHMIERCGALGEELLQRVRRLQERYPAAIREVRGAGLLLGIELARPDGSTGYVLPFLADRDLFGPVVSGYLLREQRIRIAPTLSDSFTLRIQPSVNISREHVERFMEAMEDVCEKLCTGDASGLTRFLAASSPDVESVPRLPDGKRVAAGVGVATGRDRQRNGRRPGKAGLRRVAWLFHFIDANDLAHLDPACAGLTESERVALVERFAALADPVVMEQVEIRSAIGGRVELLPIVLPVTSEWLLQRREGEKNRTACSLIQDAVDLAGAHGCGVVTLGQFTSAVTHGGRRLRSHGICMSSGNSYTAALIAQSIERAIDRQERDRHELTLAVIGAAGDIGRACATMLAPEFQRTILIGSNRPGSHRRLMKLATGIPGGEAATDFSLIACADVVVSATNCLTAPLRTEHLHPRAIVCDVSVPPTLHPSASDQLPGLTITPGAVAELPFGEDLRIPGFPLPVGHAYGCLAEGLLLGFESTANDEWVGPTSSQRAQRIAEIAERHGLRPSERESFEPREEAVYADVV